jgi:hypothetical protein
MLRLCLPILASVLLLAVLLDALAKGGGRGYSRGYTGGDHTVRSYTTKDGRYVPAHRQTNPDGTKLNNWSTKGNVNPYTGKPGTKAP